MIRLTEAQHKTLHKALTYYIIAQLDTGAVVVVFERRNQTWMVVDTDGRVYAFSQYLEIIDQRA